MARALKYASFKGVRFEVERHEDAFKRNIIKHPIALENEALYENNGVEDEGLTIDGFLAGPDASYSVDLLRKKLIENKVGRLIHPYYGMIDVLCKGYSIKESLKEMGKVNLKLSFVEISSGKNKDGLIENASNRLKITQEWIDHNVIDPFVDALEFIRVPSYVLGSSVQIISNINSFIHSNNGLGIFGDELATIGDSTNDLQGEFDRSLNSLSSLAHSIVNGIRKFPRLETAFNLYDRIERPSLVGQSPKSAEYLAIENQRAFSDLIGYAVLIRTLDEIENNPNKNYETPIKRSLEIIKKHSEDPSNDRNFTTCYLFKKIIRHSIKRKKKVFLDTWQPSLVLAYDHYQSLDAEENLLEANQIYNPLHMAGAIYVD